MSRISTSRRTMTGNLVFLLLSFPLGLLYFLLIIIGLVIGFSTLILWVGLPILFATLALARGIATIERNMVTNLLRFPFPAQSYTFEPPQQKFLSRFSNMLRDPLTWTSMIYTIIKLPLGVISFTMALVLPIVSAAVMLLPLVYLVNLFINVISLKNGISSTVYIIPHFIEVHEQFDLIMFIRSFVGVPVGLCAWFVTRFLLDGLARASAELARALLSPSERAYPTYEPQTA